MPLTHHIFVSSHRFHSCTRVFHCWPCPCQIDHFAVARIHLGSPCNNSALGDLVPGRCLHIFPCSLLQCHEMLMLQKLKRRWEYLCTSGMNNAIVIPDKCWHCIYTALLIMIIGFVTLLSNMPIYHPVEHQLLPNYRIGSESTSQITRCSMRTVITGKLHWLIV